MRAFPQGCHHQGCHKGATDHHQGCHRTQPHITSEYEDPDCEVVIHKCQVRSSAGKPRTTELRTRHPGGITSHFPMPAGRRSRPRRLGARSPNIRLPFRYRKIGKAGYSSLGGPDHRDEHGNRWVPGTHVHNCLGKSSVIVRIVYPASKRFSSQRPLDPPR